ncbi:MAG: hypothetical protein KAS71_11055 [Bacteroidales bacterium]|nr:hypothetical protein [Bacteroidales bacterium]
MKRKSIINKLELAYSPFTNYEFGIVNDYSIIEKAIEQASLYVIAQRPAMSFENIIPNQEENILEFEIHQRNNPEILKCKFPYLQKVFEATGKNDIGIVINYHDKQETQDKASSGNGHGISFIGYENNKSRFLFCISPEKFLRNFWRDEIRCEIEGDIRTFLRYKVHYTGNTTEKSILKKLIGNSPLQEIISLDHPFTNNDLPAHEIVILCFEFHDHFEIQTFGDESIVDNMVDALTGKNSSGQKTIFFEAEKALIKAMQPGYNKEMFNNFPVSNVGLYDKNCAVVSYTFMDPITLYYENGQIEGGLTPNGGDVIIVMDNKSFKLDKAKSVRL